MTLHSDEHSVTKEVARRLIRAQRPALAELPIRPAGHGTDNIMLRLGEEFVARFPRTKSAVPALGKDATWLPVLSRLLPVPIPEVVFCGQPDEQYPFPWSIYRWIEGVEPTQDTVTDWTAFGWDLGNFVDALRNAPLPPVEEHNNVLSFRGDLLEAHTDEGLESIALLHNCPAGAGLDLGAVEELWRDLTSTPQRPQTGVWLHADLRSANLLAYEGRLAGVIDFGSLGVGQPQAEHACVWDLPTPARNAYRMCLNVSDTDWLLGRGWAMLPALTGLPYYWETWPDFAALCRRRLELLLATKD